MKRALTVVFLLVLIALVAGTTFILQGMGKQESYTEFYLLGSGGKSTHYPTTVTLGDTINVTVAVVNHENATQEYFVQTEFDANAPQDVATFELQDGATWQQVVRVKAEAVGANSRVTYMLYKVAASGARSVAGRLYVLLQVTPAPSS